MKRALLLASVVTVSLLVGAGFGWWANSPGLDFMCSSPFVAELSEDIQGKGITVEAGTLVNLRSCEYAERFTVSLYYPKNPESQIFRPYNSAPNLGNHGAEQYEASKVGQ